MHLDEYYTYDGLNRVKTESVTANVNGTPQTLNRTYTYSAAGNLDRLFNRNGSHIQFNYDTLDRKISEWWRAGGTGTSIVHVLSWEYDKLGRIVKQVDGNTLAWLNGAPNTIDDIIDTFRYDGLGRLVQQANYDLDNPTFVSTAGLPRVRQTYEYFFQTTSTGQTFNDRVGRSQFLVTATGEVPIAYTQYEYDRLGRLNRTEELDSATSLGPSIERKYLQFSYDTSDNLNYVERRGNFTAGTNTWQNTFASYLTYDKSNRVTAITHDTDPAANDIRHNYSYDNASRIVGFNSYGPGGGTRGYAYDDAGQLTSKTGGSNNESYGYDDNGNRVNSGFITGLANRLTSDGAYTYLYDKEGNLIEKRLGDANGWLAVSYAWDHRNRLVSVTNWAAEPESRAVTYTYDAAGRRVKRSEGEVGAPATSEYFVYDGDDLSMSFNQTGQLTHRYLYGPTEDQVLVDEVFNAAGQSEEVLWFLGDQQNTVRDIVDDTGALRRHVDYNSVGRILDEQVYLPDGTPAQAGFPGWVDQVFYYQGRTWDGLAQLYDFGARPYDPFIARFTSEDPSGLGPDPNPYRAGRNSFGNFTDPTGLIQAGNPLNNLAKSLANSRSPLITQPRPSSSNAKLSAGTLSSVLGNSVYNAAPSYVAPASRAALSAGTSLVGAGLSNVLRVLPNSQAKQPTTSEPSALSRYASGIGQHIGSAVSSAINFVNPFTLKSDFEAAFRELPNDYEKARRLAADPGGYLSERVDVGYQLAKDRLTTPEGLGKTTVDVAALLLTRKVGQVGNGPRVATPSNGTFRTGNPLLDEAINARVAGPGGYQRIIENIPNRAAVYQSRITGRLPDVGYVVDGIKYDGFDQVAGILLDAKGPGYANFVKNGQFQPWFRGADKLVSQAQRQLQAAGGTPIQWHFAEEGAAAATSNLLKSRGLTGISIITSP